MAYFNMMNYIGALTDHIYMKMELHGEGIGCHYRPDGSRPEILEVLEAGDISPRILSGAELAQTEIDDVLGYQGIRAMHRHFLDCGQTGKTPISDIRDVINTSRLLDQIEGHGS